MNAETQYENDVVTYGYNGSRWEFQVSGSGCFTLVTACPGGRKTADKVCNAILSSIKRTKTYVEPLDQLGRWTIAGLTNPQTEDKE